MMIASNLAGSDVSGGIIRRTACGSTIRRFHGASAPQPDPARGIPPYKVASGIVWDRSGFLESLTSACAAIGYAKLRDEQAKARDEGRLAGIGIATYAELTLNPAVGWGSAL